MHVGQQRTADGILDLLENPQPLLHADPAGRAGRGAVGLVIGGFIDKPHAGVGSHAGQRLGAHQRMVQPLNLTGTGDQQQRGVTTTGHVGDVEAGHVTLSPDAGTAAMMSDEPGFFHRRGDKPGEQRMRVERF